MPGLISTRNSKEKASYTDALLQGLSPDGGLYVPTEYPKINVSELQGLTYPELAFEVKRKLVNGAIPDNDLKQLLKNAYSTNNFSSEKIVPVRKAGSIFIQNLSLGPTAAFKDMALQQLGQEMNYELKRRDENLVILGATSGDTGSSAEAAVKNLERIKLFMLSPAEGMSEFQKAQMGVLTGGNIFNISINGRFDDCQDLVKELKKDPEFSKLGAVNSINWGRISSQIPYYFSGYLQTVSKIGEEVDFVVPTGNFGNVLSGYIAKKMGLPIRRLIVATNENNVLEKLINQGVYEKTPAEITSSPSMDISKASNYERLAFELLGRDSERLSGYMEEFEKNGRVDFSDFGLSPDIFEEIGFYAAKSTHQKRLETIRKVYEESGFIIDPHTADAVNISWRFQTDNTPMIAMETALPCKFEHTIKEALGFVPERPDRFKELENTSDGFVKMPPSAEELKEYIRKN